MIEIHDSRVTRQPNNDEEPISLMLNQGGKHYVFLSTGANIETAKTNAIQYLLEQIVEVHEL